MTIVALAFSESRAMLASDTLLYHWDGSVSYRPDGKPEQDKKLHVLSHANTVFLIRGSSLLADHLYARASEVQGIEEAIEHFPRLLRDAGRLIDLGGLYKGRPRRHTCTLIGWSRSAERVMGATLDHEYGFEARPLKLGGGSKMFHFDPYRAKPFEPLPQDAESMGAYVRLQLERARADEPSVPYGGRLMLAEVDRDGIRIRDMGDLGLPMPHHAVSIGEPAMMIAANAATEIYDTSFSAGPITQSAGGGPAGSVVHSVTLTPSETGRLIVTATFDSQTTGGGSNWGSTGSRVFVKQPSVLVPPTFVPYEAFGPMISMSTTRQSQTAQSVFNVTGGASCEFGLFSELNASTGNWWNVTVSGELIKR